MPITELYEAVGDRTSPIALWAFAWEMVTWWHQAGRVYYARGCRDEDDGLRGLVADAVKVLGGWRVARLLLTEAPQAPAPMRRPHLRRIVVRTEEDQAWNNT